MPIKWLIDNNITTDVDTLIHEMVKFQEVGNKNRLINAKKEEDDGKIVPVDLKLIIDEVEVKFNIGKYNRLAIHLFVKDADQVKLFLNSAGLDIAHKLHEGVINVKISDAQKDELERTVRMKDCITVVLRFNGIWSVNKVNYASFELEHYKKIDVAARFEKYMAKE